MNKKRKYYSYPESANRWARKQRKDLTDHYIKNLIVSDKSYPATKHSEINDEDIVKKRVLIKYRRDLKSGKIVLLEKMCSVCKETKSIKLFGPDRRSMDAHSCTCRKCANIRVTKCQNRGAKRLSDGYVRALLVRWSTNLKSRDIPDSLVELKRSELAARRLIRCRTKKQNP